MVGPAAWRNCSAALLGRASGVFWHTPLEEAVRVAERAVGGAAVSTVDGELRLAVEPSRAPELVRAMVATGIDVHEVRPEQRSLEDIFFRATEQ